MIDQLADLLLWGMYWVLLAAWRAMPLFMIAILINLLFRKHIPARYSCLLWMLVIARLLLPVSTPSPLSLNSTIDTSATTLLAPTLSRLTTPSDFDVYTYQDETGANVTRPLAPDKVSQEKVDSHFAAMSEEELASMSAVGRHPVRYDRGTAVSAWESAEVVHAVLGILILVVWPAGCLLFLYRDLLGYVRFAWRLRGQATIDEQPVIDRMLRACDSIRVARRPMLKQVEMIDSPAVFGFWKPVLCLPMDWRVQLSGDKLDWVLRHELAHIKRRDGLVLLLAGIARSLHWFHPLAWIAASKLQHEMERAADELATRSLDRSEIQEYGKMLLRYAASQSHSAQRATVGLLAMAAPHGLQRRIESLAMSRPKRRWLTRLAIVPLVMLIAASGLTDAKTIPHAVELSPYIPNFDVVIAGYDWRRPDPMIAGQIPPKDVRSVSINVENALRKARELQPSVDAEKFVMGYFASYPFTAEEREKTAIVDGVLNFIATPQQESLTKQRLAAFEQSGLWQVATELKIIETSARVLNQFDWSASDSTPRCRRLDRKPFLGDSEGWEATFSIDALAWPPLDVSSFDLDQATSLPVRAIRISRLQSERLLQQAQADLRNSLISAPKVTMFNGQCGMISDLVQRPFVTDVIENSGNQAVAFQPKISVVEDGWKFLMKTTVTNDEKVNLQVVLNHSSIDGVKLANLPHLNNESNGKVTIQVPSVRSSSIAVESVLSTDEALLVFSPTPYPSEESDAGSTFARSMGWVYMVRTQAFSDSDVLKSYVTTKTEE